MTAQELDIELAKLLDRDIASVRDWESSEFDRLAKNSNGKLVLFGAGGLGKKTLAGLRSLNIEPLAFADNNTALHGGEVQGVPVLSPQQAAQQYGQDALFVVTIWGGHSPDRMNQRIEFLQSLGCRNVLSFYPLYCKYAGAYLPHYACDLPHHALEEADTVRKVGKLWSDEGSRREFLAQVTWRAAMDFSLYPEPVKHEIYFPDDLCQLREDEVFVDCGAFDGDTLRSFLKVSGGKFARAVGFEPDPANFAKLKNWRDSQSAEVAGKIGVEQYAVDAEPGTVRFTADGTEAAFVGQDGDIEVEAIALDGYFGESPVTYLKMDIEGAELNAVRGAANLIKRDRPVLTVCVYHKQNHLWAIADELSGLCENYNFYLRPHLLEGWDTVLYAIPSERVLDIVGNG